MSETWLDQLVGNWTYEGQSVPDEPEHRRGGAVTAIRRDTWVVIESDGEYRFQFAAVPGSDKVVGDFVHFQYPNLWTYDGTFEDGRLHLRSRGPSFDVEDEAADYDDVLEIVSPDEWRLTSHVLGADGQWRDICVNIYRRTG